MERKLFVVQLGHQNSGKSTTWRKLFKTNERLPTRTRSRELLLNENLSVEVVLINGSPEERQKPISEILGANRPKIILCSIQYIDAGWDTLKFAIDNGYELYVQWLNPGYGSDQPYPDTLKMEEKLSKSPETTFETVNVNNARDSQLDKIRNFIVEWVD